MSEDDSGVGRRAYVGALAGLFGGALGSGTASALPESAPSTAADVAGAPSASTAASGDAVRGDREVSGDARKWTAQHSTHVELGEVETYGDATEFDGKPAVDVLTNTTLSVLDATWMEFGNPAKGSSDEGDHGTGCWRYTFQLNSFAFALTPKRTEWFDLNDNGVRKLTVLSESTGYEPAAEVFNPSYRTKLSDFVRVQGPDPSNFPEQARRVAVAARRDPDLFGIANGQAVVGRLHECLESGNGECLGTGESPEKVRGGLRALVDASRGEDVLNAAKLRAHAAEKAEDAQALQNLALAALGIAALFASGGTLGAVLLAIDVALAVVEFFFNDTDFETPYNRGFEVETPTDSERAGALASHFVTFDVYATPGEPTRFTVDSRHEYDVAVTRGADKDLYLDQQRSAEACAPKWTVHVRAPADEEASPELLYDGIEPVRADFERNESQPPQPGISFHGARSLPEEDDNWGVQPGQTFHVNAYDSLLSKTRPRSRDIEWTLERSEGCDLRPAECNNFEVENWEAVDDGSGWTWSFTPERPGEYRVSVTIGGARPSGTTRERFEVHPVPEVDILSPSNGWAEVETEDPVVFRGDASHPADMQLFTYWEFPAEARGRDGEGIPPGDDVRRGDPSTITREPEAVGSGVSFTFTEPGMYDVRYIAADADGYRSTTSMTVHVSPGDSSTTLDPILSDHVHANVRLASSEPVRVGESARLVASDSHADGPRRIIGFDWDLSGTGENFVDLSGDDEGSLEGQLEEGTISVPPGGEFTSTGEETVQVLAYAIDPQSETESELLVAGLAEFTFSVEATTEPEPAITPIPKSHPLARQHQKLKPIGDGSYWSKDTVRFFTAHGTEMVSDVAAFEWTFEPSSSSSVTVTRQTPGAIFHEFSGEGEHVVELTAVYEDGREATTRRRVVVG